MNNAANTQYDKIGRNGSNLVQFIKLIALDYTTVNLFIFVRALQIMMEKYYSVLAIPSVLS